jgi:ribosomal protein S18 acetylase RimI-like enzyme
MNGIRPVNLQTDLAPIADLIELVFAPTMDEGGRTAIREMRALSRMGVGVGMFARLNELAMGIKMGYVWEEAGQLIGNVSVYPANLPDGSRDTWIIANVGVHPTYQGRGIARQLMEASLDMLRARGAQKAILQVDEDNARAITLYERLGFLKERAFTQWRRNSLTPVPSQDTTEQPFITRRRDSEWQAEYALAQMTRPNERGGLGWLRPTHPALFKPSLWKTLTNWLTMQGVERLVIRGDNDALLACLWLENTFGSFSTRLTAFAHPHHAALINALLGNVVRRFRTTTLEIEHPADDEEVAHSLRHYRFLPTRTVYQMRWQAV